MHRSRPNSIAADRRETRDEPLTATQLAGIKKLVLWISADGYNWEYIERFKSGDFNGLTGVDELDMTNQASFTLNGLHAGGAPPSFLGQLKKLVLQDSDIWKIESADFFRGLSRLETLWDRHQQHGLRAARQGRPPRGDSRRPAHQPRGVEAPAEPALPVDRQQPHPDAAARVLPPPDQARRTRHVRHVVRVPPLRVRLPGARLRNLRGASAASGNSTSGTTRSVQSPSTTASSKG